ncbi:MAG: ATP-grasp domain-containing protein [Anaerolineales bacterium]|nr:ATP-grasp domain-containing protein [Anaerolineales bacterium]MCX7609058.1 ATP-grasp domain-containing protein [Anaerolineales bacterium]MDW8226942.1 biotin carboxylase N-terminal domain-containing protein [Anaerolineales bacterium]
MTRPKILVANRGEIAVRILRTCREMGLPSVAVYTSVDQSALHVRSADEAIFIGEPRQYLNIQAILQAAQQSGATAIHPGYGFLAENADFARAVEAAGLIFIGPRAETVARMGDKLAARRAARKAGLPVLAGTDAPLPPDLPVELIKTIQYPVLVKAAAGGGGRGIRLARSPEELPAMIEAARREAQSAFQDDTVFLESLVQSARHIEVQILGDGKGNVLCLGERECSIQRRRQKLIEEAPAPGLPDDLRRQIHEAALQLGRSLRYRSLGTVEFLLDDQGRFYFIEVNPRIQVEHPVTEMVTGLDIVQHQIALALGEPLRLRQEDIHVRGAAIEARILAEDSQAGFLPSTGEILYLKEPGGPGIRVDSALYPGMKVGAEYDSLLAKLIAWGETREHAIRRLQRALHEYQIGGLSTDIDFLLQIIESPAFLKGEVNTTYLESFSPKPPEPSPELERQLAFAAALYAHYQQSRLGQNHPNRPISYWQMVGWREQMNRL